MHPTPARTSTAASNPSGSFGGAALVAAPGGARIRSLDILRGIIMVLMAIDHVRLFLTDARFDPTDLSNTTPAIFLTRWITHFCAPGFVFLAGVGAFLYAVRVQSKPALSRYLLLRGAWLILLELSFLRIAWTLNLDFAHYMLAGVIWVIGWALIALAALVWLPLRAIGAVGLVIILGHNALDAIPPAALKQIQSGGWAWLWRVAISGGPVRLGAGGPTLFVLYSLIPWIGVIAAGYAFGPVMRMSPQRRRAWCLSIGFGAIAIFILLRAMNLYGDAKHWSDQPSALFTALSFLNTRKYPASLLYLLMTLGPTIVLIPALESTSGPISRILTTFGRVPLFYYMLHIPLIHLTAIVLSLFRYSEIVPWLTANQPVMAGEPPEGYGYPLWVVYVVTGMVVAALYPACRWFAALKQRRSDVWLTFL